MVLRKICKCCGKKRDQHYLQTIGFAHNNGKIWICKDRYKCNEYEWQSVKDVYQSKLVTSSPILSEIEKRTQEHRKLLFGGSRY